MSIDADGQETPGMSAGAKPGARKGVVRLGDLRKASVVTHETKVVALPETTRLSGRGALIAAFARAHGIDLSPADVSEALLLRRRNKADRGLPEIGEFLGEQGLLGRVRNGVAPDDGLLPMLALMTTGQIIMITDATDSHVTIYDPADASGHLDVPRDEFLPYYTGQVFEVAGRARLTGTRIRMPSDAPHWFWGQFRQFRRQIGEIAVGSLVSNILAVSVAIFSMQVYDRVIPHQSEPTLWVLAIGAFAALLLEGLLKLARAHLTDRSGREIELSVQSLLMKRLIGMRARFADAAPSQMFTAMRDFNSVREFFTAGTLGTLTDLPFVLMFLVLILSIGGPVVLVVIAGAVLMVVPSLLARRALIRLTREHQAMSAQSARLLHETIFDLETIKGQRGEERVLRDWDTMCQLSALSSAEHRKVQTRLTMWAAGVQQATFVCVVIVGAYLTFTGDFTTGTIIATGILTTRTLGPLTQLTGMLSRWSNVSAALEALDMVADAPQEEEPGRRYLRRDRLLGDYALSGVRFAYGETGPNVVTLDQWRIPVGSRIALVGANGSGKSTLLRLLSGLVSPVQGDIRLDGCEMAQIAPRDLRRNIGYMGQEIRLFTGTLRDNLNLNLLENNDDRLLQALDFAGLGDMVRGHPLGLDLEITDGGRGLSVGQRQSIGWARLWLQDPRIVLLDEPTAALDQRLEADLVGRVADWLGPRTLILATHRVPILSLVDQLAVMHGGRIVRVGSRDTIIAEVTDQRGAAENSKRVSA